MDNPVDESLLLSKTNSNITNILKIYAQGGVSMAEILDKMDLSFDIESMVTATTNFIPENVLTNGPDLEESMEAELDIRKEVNIPNQYIPGKVFFPQEIDSSLTKREQAMCLNALKARQSISNINHLTRLQQQDIKLSAELQSKIQAENIEFIKYVKNDWKIRQSRALGLKQNLKNYAHLQWQRKLGCAVNYPQFYKVEQTVPFSCQENDSEVDIHISKTLNEVGIVPKFVRPCLESKHTLKVYNLPSENPVPVSALPVSEDPTIEELLKTESVDIVISSSGLKQLMDDTDSNYEWCIPVIVKEPDVKSGNGQKSVVYIDKPMPKRFPTPIDFNYYCQKLLIKTTFCCYPGITYNTHESYVSPNALNSCEPDQSCIKNNIADNSKDRIDFTEELHHLSDLLERKRNGQNIFDAINAKPKIFHNASYNLWSMQPKNDEKSELLKSKCSNKTINVLIRCKIDACEESENNQLRPLVIVPKPEYQLEYGANIPTKKEIIDQWTALFFRPYSNMYRIRLQSNNLEVIDVQSVSLQQLNNEANIFYQYKPHLRLGVLHRIFAKLTELKCGKYVLHYRHGKGLFFDILSESQCDISEKVFNFYDMYSAQTCAYKIPKQMQWIPIDTSYILPVHDTFKRMPGLFKPLIRTISKKGKKKNKSKKKKKICATLNNIKQ